MKPTKRARKKDSTMLNNQARKKEIDQLSKRMGVVETYLIYLANFCWQSCGTDFVKEVAKSINKAKK